MKRKNEDSFMESSAKRPKITNSSCGVILKKVKEEHLLNGSFDCPEVITQLGEFAFSSCFTKLTQIILPKKLTHILNYALIDCTNLTLIMLPEEMIFIGKGAFQGCTSLTHVRIPKSILRILDNTFSGCTNLTAIILSENIQSIKKNAFLNCTKLQFIFVYGANKNKLEHIRNLLPEELKNQVELKCFESIINWQLNAKAALGEKLIDDIASNIYTRAFSFFSKDAPTTSTTSLASNSSIRP